MLGADSALKGCSALQINPSTPSCWRLGMMNCYNYIHPLIDSGSGYMCQKMSQARHLFIFVLLCFMQMSAISRNSALRIVLSCNVNALRPELTRTKLSSPKLL